MSPLFDVKRLLQEGVPIAAVLLFWTALSLFTDSPVAGGLRYAGVVMAALYVVVRGVELAGSFPVVGAPETPGELLLENASVAVSASLWFAGAVVAYAVFLDPLGFVLTGTGVGTVLLYAVAVGLPRVRAAAAGEAGATPAGD